MEVIESRNWMLCGREFSATEVAEICATVAWLPGLSRKELAATLCAHLSWVTLTGTAKIDACLEFLGRWQGAGLLALPALRPAPPRRGGAAPAAAPVAAEPLIDCPLSELAPVCLEVVRDVARTAQWDALVARWHPLGFQGDVANACATSSPPASSAWVACCYRALPAPCACATAGLAGR